MASSALACPYLELNSVKLIPFKRLVVSVGLAPVASSWSRELKSILTWLLLSIITSLSLLCTL